ncbi:MAG: TIGR01620 family protein [Rhizobiaceae bacterium]|nr:TIGR01620 family protein [Rhizobiaceae bacterium]
MTTPRKPASFRMEPEKPRMPAEPEADAAAAPVRRQPRAARPETVVITPAELDVFDLEAQAADEPPLPLAPRRRSRLAAIFWSALGALISLALGLWTDRLIRDLFSRSDWLGWVGIVLAALVALSLGIILIRELLSLFRLASVEKLRRRGAEAMLRDDPKAARGVVEELVSLFASRPETAAGRSSLAELRNDIIDGSNLVRLAEAEILAPLDLQAKTLILNAAKRVSLVTAVSPRALVDIAYVVFESGRLIRRLSELYGGRPGTLGFVRLTRDVLAHLAVTGSIAAGDSVVQQLVGQGLAARLSAKLGEGVVNGMMTARIGLAAMDAVRPLPFASVKRPGLADFLAALATFTAKKSKE